MKSKLCRDFFQRGWSRLEKGVTMMVFPFRSGEHNLTFPFLCVCVFPDWGDDGLQKGANKKVM